MGQGITGVFIFFIAQTAVRTKELLSAKYKYEKLNYVQVLQNYSSIHNLIKIQQNNSRGGVMGEFKYRGYDYKKAIGCTGNGKGF